MASQLGPYGPDVDGDPDVLFIGISATAVAWYRCFLPAIFMGADWIGVEDDPPELSYVTGLVGGQTALPNYFDYKVIVVQQPRGKEWFRLIKMFQQRGIKVIFEVDDYLHAIARMKDHDFAQEFGRAELKQMELNMRACDAIICSTEFIARKYHQFNANVWVCPNGLDLGRYDLTRPERPTVNIGWAGATGHRRAVQEWFAAAAEVLDERANTWLVSIGPEPYAHEFGRHRGLAIPFAPLESYPAAMCTFDIALAPAGPGLFFRGKSDLRWLEAAALGIPVIADPVVYPNIEDGVTGFHASSPAEVKDLLLRLVDDPKLRVDVGDRAKAYVGEHRGMDRMVAYWLRALNEVAAL